jgi:LuxR family maltose regulon positive regulatory protein
MKTSWEVPSPLIYTKVHIPRNAHLFSRGRLLDFLQQNIQRKLLLVCAGPGYGKTSLLVDFAQHTDLAVCWYTLDPSDRDTRTFLEYLIESIRVRFPSFGERARALLRQGNIPDFRGAIGLLVNELVEIHQPVLIVLDEYHTVEMEEGINRAVSLLLQYLPENVHLILAGRLVPSLPLISLMARGDVAGIGTNMLRFTPEEVQAVLSGLGLHPPEEQVCQMTEESEGWITGILLGSQIAWLEFMRFLAGAQGTSEPVYAYVTGEVLSQLPSEIRKFLRQVCVLGRMEPALCDSLLERQGSAAVLEWLEQRNIFLVALEGGWYRFHGLFRESLLREARQDAEAFVRLNLRAAQLWRERGEVAEVVEHLVQAQAYSEAAQEIERLALEYLVRGRLRTLLRWIESLPQSEIAKCPRLALFRARVCLRMGRQEALAMLQQVEELLAQRGDWPAWVQARADRGTHLRQKGYYSDALRIAHETLQHAEESHAPAIVDLYRTLGICCHAQGDLAAAEAHLRTAVERSAQMPSLYNQALALQDWGICLRAQGHVRQAEAAYRGALERWEALGNPGPVATTLNNLAFGSFLRGDFGEALELLRQAGGPARDSLSPEIQALVRASLADVQRDQRDYSAARQSYQEALELARRAGHAPLLIYLQEALGDVARRQGDFSAARRYLQVARDSVGESQYDRARVQITHALLETAAGRPEQGAKLLEEAAAMAAGGDWLLLLRIRLAQSITWDRLGRADRASEALGQAVSIAEETGAIEPFLTEAEALRPLLRKSGLRRGTFWQDVCQRVQEAAQPRIRLPMEENDPLLRLVAFGSGQVFREGAEIPRRAWQGRARELAFYILLHAPVRKEEICLAFWPDSSPAAVRNSLHSALYRARRAVGVPFVRFSGNAYTWNPEVAFWCDVLAFERALDSAESLPAAAPQASVLLERAVDLYQGDFLEDFDSEWCIAQREELRERYVQALLRLGGVYLEQGDEAARRTYEKALQADNFREEAYRGLMRCHMQAGERASAIQVYQRCRQLLRQELGIVPSDETEALYRTIAGEG